jgi:pilus assembly protein CpaC
LQATLDNYAHAGGSHVVNLLRLPGEQQIMLRIVVAEVNQQAARNLGLDFGLADRQATVLPNRAMAADGTSTFNGNGWVGQILRTLQEHNLAQTLAEPTLTTLNGQAARFQAGGEFPIPVVSPSPAGAVQGVAFRSYGVQLSVQPIVAAIDRIRLTVEAEVSGTDPQATAQVGGTSVPGLKMRNFQTTVELKEGETLAVAGLTRGSSGNALPQGVYPANPNNTAPAQELVVLISPLLLHHAGSEPVEMGNPLNAQNIEMYLRSRDSQVSRGDSLFLIGPQGYAGEANQGSSMKR